MLLAGERAKTISGCLVYKAFFFFFLAKCLRLSMCRLLGFVMYAEFGITDTRWGIDCVHVRGCRVFAAFFGGTLVYPMQQTRLSGSGGGWRLRCAVQAHCIRFEAVNDTGKSFHSPRLACLEAI